MESRVYAAVSAVSFLLAYPLVAMAGSLEPAGPPGSLETDMKSLNEIEPRTLISALPFTITNAGSYYVVGNLVGVAGSNGITIVSSHVQLDLNGFALIGSTNAGGGDNSTLVGVLISDADLPVNIAIRNGVICNWGREGMRSVLAKDCRVTGISVSQNGGTNGYDGMQLGSWWTISDCLAAKNGGHGISAGSQCTISRSVFRENTKCGLNVNTECRIFDCSAMWNYLDGFRTGDDVEVRNCFANQNSSNGISVAMGCVVANCFSSFNSNAGIESGGEGRIEGNHVRKNHYGIQIPSGGGNQYTLVIRNSAVMNWPSCDYDVNTNTHYGTILNSSNLPAGFSIPDPHANFSLSP